MRKKRIRVKTALLTVFFILWTAKIAPAWFWNPIQTGIQVNFNGVWASSGSEVFIVGDEGFIGHYDGTSITSMTSNTQEDLKSIWGNSSVNIYAVGTGGVLLHYNGNNEGGFWFEGMQQDKEKKIMSTVIPESEMLTIELYPAELRVQSALAASYVNENMMPGENGIQLTVDINGEIVSETQTFTFTDQ